VLHFCVPDSLTPQFQFLASGRFGYPPPNLPFLPLIGKVTPISGAEREGTLRHKGVERIWKCMHPYLPVQCTPQLNLSVQRAGVELKRASVRVYIHPLGLVSTL